jgi:hypothetical protein
MQQRGVKVVEGFDADDAAFQAELVRASAIVGVVDGCGCPRWCCVLADE